MRLKFPLVFSMAAGVLLVAGPAHAKRIEKMTDGELLQALKEDTKPERRAAAARAMGSRNLQSAVSTLGSRCGTDPNLQVCLASLNALAALGTADAFKQVQSVLLRDKAPPEGRLSALAILLEAPDALVLSTLPDLIQRYRRLPPDMVTELMVATRLLEQGQLADAAVLIASDNEIHPAARVAALDTAERFAPPRLYEAHMALIGDSRVRKRCAEGLGGPGLPASQVVPVLQQVVQKDPEGYVRAAALQSLAQYAHPELLLLLHERLTAERHPVGTKATLDLAVTLANESSVPSLARLLETNRSLKPEDLALAVRKLAHLKDPRDLRRGATPPGQLPGRGVPSCDPGSEYGRNGTGNPAAKNSK